MIFDTHAHYYEEAYDDDRDNIIRQAYAEGVTLILVPGTDDVTNEQAVALTDKYDYIYGAVGYHPHEAVKFGDTSLGVMTEQLCNPKIRAIGEVGLDYYYDLSPRDIQKKVFAEQIALAKQLKYPIIIHDRDAHADTLDIVRAENARDIGGVFHCYSGSVEMLRDVLNNNMYISVGGAVTFKNAVKIKDVLKYVPFDRLMLETDCPYMTPVPYRGKRNYSGYLKYVIEEIATVLNTDCESVEKQTYSNGRALFGI